MNEAQTRFNRSRGDSPLAMTPLGMSKKTADFCGSQLFLFRTAGLSPCNSWW